MKRIVVVLALAALVTALVGGSRAAQAEDPPRAWTYGPQPFGVSMENPCTGEFVEISGEGYGVLQEMVTPSGTYLYNFHFRSFGTGVGSEGNKYIYRFTDNTQFNSEDPADEATVFTNTFEWQVISQTSDDNFVVNQEIHVSPGTVQFHTVSTECRG